MPKDYDGSFYALGPEVHRRPKRFRDGVSLGFHVLTLAAGVGDRVENAKAIAALLTKHWKDT